MKYLILVMTCICLPCLSVENAYKCKIKKEKFKPKEEIYHSENPKEIERLYNALDYMISIAYLCQKEGDSDDFVQGKIAAYNQIKDLIESKELLY